MYYNRDKLFEASMNEMIRSYEDDLVDAGHFPSEFINSMRKSQDFPVCLLTANDKIDVTRTDAGPIYTYAEGDRCFDIYHGIRGILDNLTPETEYVVVPLMKSGWEKIKNCTRDHIYVGRKLKLTPGIVALAMGACMLQNGVTNSNIASWGIAHNSGDVLEMYDNFTTNKIPENRLTSVLVDKLIVTRRFDVLEYLVKQAKRKSEDGKLPVWITDALNKRIDEIDCDEYRDFINLLIND